MVIQSVICIVHSTQFTIFCISITFDFVFVLNYTSYITIHYDTWMCILLFLLGMYLCVFLSRYIYVFLSLYIYYSKIIISLYHIIEVLIRTPFSSCILYLLYIVIMPHRLISNNTLSFLGTYVRTYVWRT